MRCPGQDTRYWKPGDIFEAPCPTCGNILEFFKDEPARSCKNCGHRVINPRMDFGCASYCKFAEQCIGELPPDLLAQRQELFKNRVAIEMKQYFHKDFKRIGHAAKVSRYAEQIALKEKADMAVVLTAAYLHDVGIKEAERKYKSAEAAYQEELGPPIAEAIMERLGAPAKLIKEVCDIIGHHHHPRPDETLNFKALYDADMLVNIEESRGNYLSNKESLEALIDKKFLTETGKKLAREVLLK
ncbi:HD domain-containing protein [bacterium]|nr:HD domain-containing protein [bacterium]